MYQIKKVQVTVLLWREEMFSGINPLAKTIVVCDACFETLFRSTALEKFDTAEFLLPNASPSNVFSVRIVWLQLRLFIPKMTEQRTEISRKFAEHGHIPTFINYHFARFVLEAPE